MHVQPSRLLLLSLDVNVCRTADTFGRRKKLFTSCSCTPYIWHSCFVVPDVAGQDFYLVRKGHEVTILMSYLATAAQQIKQKVMEMEISFVRFFVSFLF